VTIDTNIDGADYVTDYFIEGLPVDKATGNIDDNTASAAIPLHDWLGSVVEINAHHYNATSSILLWQTSLSLTNCPAAFSAINAAATFPSHEFGYDAFALVGYNSNTFLEAIVSHYTAPQLPFLTGLGLASVDAALSFNPLYMGWGYPILLPWI